MSEGKAIQTIDAEASLDGSNVRIHFHREDGGQNQISATLGQFETFVTYLQGIASEARKRQATFAARVSGADQKEAS